MPVSNTNRPWEARPSLGSRALSLGGSVSLHAGVFLAVALAVGEATAPAERSSRRLNLDLALAPRPQSPHRPARPVELEPPEPEPPVPPQASPLTGEEPPSQPPRSARRPMRLASAHTLAGPRRTDALPPRPAPVTPAEGSRRRRPGIFG